MVAVQLLGKAHTPTLFTGSTATETRKHRRRRRAAAAAAPEPGPDAGFAERGQRRGPAAQHRRLPAGLRHVDRHAAVCRPARDLARSCDSGRWTTPTHCSGVLGRHRRRWPPPSGSARRCAARGSRQSRDGHRHRRDGAATGRIRAGGAQPAMAHRARRRRLADDLLVPAAATSPRSILAQAWSLRADGIIQNITLFADGSLDGDRDRAQRTAADGAAERHPQDAAGRAGPGGRGQHLRTACRHCTASRRGALRGPLILPIGPSGVLLGKVAAGNRLMLPLGRPRRVQPRPHRRGGRMAKRSWCGWPAPATGSRCTPAICGGGTVSGCRTCRGERSAGRYPAPRSAWSTARCRRRRGRTP